MQSFACHRRKSGAKAAFVLVLSAWLLAGCQSRNLDQAGLERQDYRLRHPIMVSEEAETLDIPIGMRGGHLSPEIKDAIYDYALGYRDTGIGSVTVQVPSGSGNDIAAAAASRAIRAAVLEAGVEPELVRVAPYRSNASRAAPVRLSYLKVKAVTPKCGVWPDDVTATADNREYYNFGCASQHNLAAMVANPADLLQPRQMSPANATRRAKVLQDYASGSETKSGITLISSDLGD
ncbi:CpaD family pilus assembly protein [Afifella sp. H1R]|uniref:CpaD family pilus assembly protein n=1 Tax=Afifella sp. H1R TaxID=2908841 RepID=UPI001F48A751|nr:CpaD family pilus assembly protein [Afifella sp. H1R]MCF1504891.1 CpaD family pilus assembly protein [Afifella sp. H1R]